MERLGIKQKEEEQIEEFHQSYAYSDNKICDTTKEDLKKILLDCQSVKIADGREKGGERGMIIVIHLKPNESEHVQLILAFECSWQSEKNLKADLDYTNVVIGDSKGSTVGIFIAYMTDTKQYFESLMTNEDEESYIEKWLVKLVNRNYFKKDALKYEW